MSDSIIKNTQEEVDAVKPEKEDNVCESVTDTIEPVTEDTPTVNIEDAPSAVETELKNLKELFLQEFQTFKKQQALNEKLQAANERLTKQNDEIHCELTKFRQGLLDKINKSFILEIIGLSDKLSSGLGIEQIPEELDIILSNEGIIKFQSESDRFDCKTQTAIKTTPTDDPEKFGLIIERIHPGYRRDSDDYIIRREFVSVYAKGT
jgi:molecular chaperone GrpE (heat shock protein)